MRRPLRADKLLSENIRTLLNARREDDKSLAMWCGHQPAWISKVLSGERGVQIKELGRIADFFGLTVDQLFQPGISPLAERRQAPRRTMVDRRSGTDRRQPRTDGRLHPDVMQDPFRKSTKRAIG